MKDKTSRPRTRAEIMALIDEARREASRIIAEAEAAIAERKSRQRRNEKETE